ncbi:unnamed protein product [Rotaria sordida]|uniref:Uncharacterized protein n=1 Tax=Rotaria sordida TaxID=392033 RepID=A0A815AMU9_9BILA|nr:unnamed protein product [Rotaria sordida]CAF4122734.1 unnamed protein product [Rotaria sordida]
MEGTKRIRKPALCYDPSAYVLAPFLRKKKHTIIPKHQVTIDTIDKNNENIKSFGFIQPVHIIAEDISSNVNRDVNDIAEYGDDDDDDDDDLIL